ncbi:Ecdysteroid kinase-like family [Popillia japonica]|uniref:Ecdysteroid kinase-like family n=1 Tax=Popillia japonica TaxID=7064 RepID=A0AAW1JFZ4_POPJA
MALEIKDFESLIEPSLKPGQKFLWCECKRLLSPGENYGSIMLQVEARVSNQSGANEIIHCVAKTCPPTDMIKEIFNTKVTFKREIEVYKTLVPSLNEFGKENGLDNVMNFFATFLGGRVSLNPNSDVVDDDAVLLLENLKVKGYDTVDRFTGFNLDCAKFLLNDLATLHGVTLAYRLKKPEEFAKKIRPHLKKAFSFNVSDDLQVNAVKGLEAMLVGESEFSAYIPKAVEAIMKVTSISIEDPPKERELFATFTHNDFWVNNTMLRIEEGKPVSNRMVDFQVIEYRSLAHDVLFFLYSSVELSVLENHLDDLFQYYYDQFVGILKKFNCDVSEFTFENYMQECKNIAIQEELGHILIMFPGIMTLKEKAKELSDIKESDMVAESTSVHENCLRKMKFTLSDFAKRGWL